VKVLKVRSEVVCLWSADSLILPNFFQKNFSRKRKINKANQKPPAQKTPASCGNVNGDIYSKSANWMEGVKSGVPSGRTGTGRPLQYFRDTLLTTVVVVVEAAL